MEIEQVRYADDSDTGHLSRDSGVFDLTVCHWLSLYFLRLRRLTFLFPPSNKSSRWPSDTPRDITAEPRCPPPAYSTKPSEELILTAMEM